MSESLIAGVREFLRAAHALYGAGDLAAGPPSPVPIGPVRVPPMSGAAAAVHAEAVATNNTWLDQLNNRDRLVGSLMITVGDSVGFGRRVVEEGSAVFESSVAALGPSAASPFGALVLLAPAASVVAGVANQIATSSGLMQDLAKQTPGQLDADPSRRVRQVVRRRTRGAPVYLASSTQRSSQPSGSLGADTRGKLKPEAQALYDALMQKYPGAHIGGWRPPDGYNEHSSGSALDFMTTNPAQAYAVMDQAFGSGANYVLWNQTQYNPDGSTVEMEDRGSPTQNHMDHLHINIGRR